MTRAPVVTFFGANSDAGRASPAVAVEIVRINSRRDIPSSSVEVLCLPDWAAVEAAWRSSLARGVCAIMELVCLAAIVLFCPKDFNTALHALHRPGVKSSLRNPMPSSGRNYIIVVNAISTKASGV